MREVKFRAWDEEEKCFWTFDDAGEESGNGTIQFHGENGRLLFGRLVDIDVGVGLATDFTEFSLVEYAGLKDKNDREIYEGGIALRRGKRYLIKKEIGSFMLVRIDDFNMYDEFENCWNDDVYPLSQLYWENGDSDYTISDLEIIGTVFENPELLKEQTR